MRETLLIISLGQLGTNLLEAVCRTNLFDRIVVASRSQNKAVERANNAIVGAGIEGYFPTIEAIELNVDDPSFARKISSANPDIIFSAPTLMPWWKVPDLSGEDPPFGLFTALHLAPMVKLRDKIAQCDLSAKWIGGSYPDVINPALVASGFGPEYGIGNVQEPIAKIQRGVGHLHNAPPSDVKISLVAQHAFEYYAMREEGATDLPPYMLQASLYGKDVSESAEIALREPFPFPYDLFFNRITASAGLMTLRALLSESPQHIHMPGCIGLPGGYPVVVNRNGIELDLPEQWSRAKAIETNRQSMATEGIAGIESDGTILYTENVQRGLHKLTGKTYESVNSKTVFPQANTLMSAMSKYL